MVKNRIFSWVLLIALLFCLTGLSFADDSPYDRNTEVYYEANFKWDGVQNVVTDMFEKFQQIEVLEPVFSKIKSKTGISLKEDIFSWFGNRLRFGVVGDDNSSVLHNSIKEYMMYSKSHSELKAEIQKLRVIKTAIEIYKFEKKKLPPNLKVLTKTSIKPADLKPVRGSHFTYKVLPDGQFIIKAPKDKFKDLGLTGELPSYHSMKGFSGDIPRISKKFKFKNWLLTIKVRNSDKAREAFPKLEKLMEHLSHQKAESFKKQVWNKYIFRVSKGVCYTFYGREVFIADTAETLQKAIISMGRADKNIYTNKVFKDMLKENPGIASSTEFMFVNLKKIDLNSKLMGVKEKSTGAEILNNLYYMTYFFKRDKDGAVGDMVINLAPGMKKDTLLKQYAAKPLIDSSSLIENLPGEIPIAVSYNIGEVWSFLEVLGEKEPAVKKGLKEFQAGFGMMSGLNFMDNIVKPIGGKMALSYMPRDAFLAGMIQAMTSVMRKIPKGKKISEPNDLRPEKIFRKMFRIQGMPFTFFMHLKDKDGIQDFIKVLEAKGKFEREYYNDVAIYKSKKMVYCIVEDMLIIHTFPGTIKVKQFIDQLKEKRIRLSETTRYREFKQGVRGKVIMMQFQDAQWAAKIAEGFVMFFLPEFSDYAKQVGQYKESWTSFSITDRGLQIHIRGFNKK